VFLSLSALAAFKSRVGALLLYDFARHIFRVHSVPIPPEQARGIRIVNPAPGVTKWGWLIGAASYHAGTGVDQLTIPKKGYPAQDACQIKEERQAPQRP